MVVDTLYSDHTTYHNRVELPFDLTEVTERAMKRVYRKHSTASDLVPRELLSAVTATLNSAVSTEFIQEEPELCRMIEANNEVFAAFKVHDECSRMAQLLTDENGRLRSFEEWRTVAEPIASHHNRVWMRTEYDTAVKRAEFARQWKQFEREADVLPNLKWIPSTAVTPSEDHRVFWNTVLPMDDPFWSMHKPGDRWGCQCGLEATDEPPTGAPSAGDKQDEPAPGLDNNPAKDGKLIGESHPYYPGSCATCPFSSGKTTSAPTNKAKNCATCKNRPTCNETRKSDISSMLKALRSTKGKEHYNLLKSITEEKAFKPVKGKEGVFEAPMQVEKREYENLLYAAEKMTNHGYRVFMLPNPKKNQSPDYILEKNGLYKDCDLKSITGQNSLSNRLEESEGQSRRVLIHLQTTYNSRRLAEDITQHFNSNKDASEVLVLKGKQLIRLDRKMDTQTIIKMMTRRK